MPDIKGGAEGAASKGKGALTHKVGPLPLWGWAVAGVAAVIVAKKLTGGGAGSSAGPGLVTIPNLGSGAPAGSVPSGTTVANPDQNHAGGADTVTGSTAPAVPWWAPTGMLSNAQPGWYPIPSDQSKLGWFGGIPLPPPPSTNGSPGAGPATSTPTGAAPSAPSWWSRITNPAGNLPAGAAATTVGGITYSLSSDALGRAGITGASAPTAPATPPASTTASSQTTSAPPATERAGVGGENNR